MPRDLRTTRIFLKIKVMKKALAIVVILVGALTLLAAAVFYFRGLEDGTGSEDKNVITIPEGIQSQFGDLRIGVATIKEKAEYVDSEGNPIDTGSIPPSVGPIAKLAIADQESDYSMNVATGDSYPVGNYEMYVQEIVLGTEGSRGLVTLRITSEVDKNPTIINHVVSLPPVDTEKRKAAYAFAYLDTVYGEGGENWQYISVDRAAMGGRVYDTLTIKLADGSEELVHFDVTAALRQIAKKALEDLTDITFSKNSGEAVEDAILIRGAESDKAGVDSEYVYLNAKYGLRGLDWELVQQALLTENGREYDQMDLKLFDGTEKTLYFDITEFFGKGIE